MKRTRQVTAYRRQIMQQIKESYQGARPSEAKSDRGEAAAANLNRYRHGKEPRP